jgi:transcriptional regulator GlxA family with amidase domain
LRLPGAAPLALAAIEQLLDEANRHQRACRYTLEMPEPQGEAGGIDALSPQALQQAQLPFAAFVVASADTQAAPALLTQLRQLGQGGTHLLGVDAGAAVLAEAGALASGRAAVSLSVLDAMIEDFPQIVWTDRIWDGEGLRWSCGPGLAAVDLLLAWLTHLHGDSLAQALLASLGLEAPRGREVRQRRPLSERVGGSSPKLAEALALMEANLAEPLPTEDVARLVGVSRRQLERLFKQHLDALPSRHYAELRLQRARRLLQQSGQSILQIGLSCGFASGPHFSNAYKAFFGHTPREERSQRAANLRLGTNPIPPLGDPS